VNNLSPILLPIVSVGFGITSATIATLLYFTTRNVRQQEGPREEDFRRKRVPVRKTAKKPQAQPSKTEKSVTGTLAAGPRARAPISGSWSPRRGTAQDSGNEEDESGIDGHIDNPLRLRLDTTSPIPRAQFAHIEPGS